jgi:glucose/arabinose dehydrogenase
MQAHSAPLGASFYHLPRAGTSPATAEFHFPADYHGALLVAQHGR